MSNDVFEMTGIQRQIFAQAIVAVAHMVGLPVDRTGVVICIKDLCEDDSYTFVSSVCTSTTKELLNLCVEQAEDLPPCYYCEPHSRN